MSYSVTDSFLHMQRIHHNLSLKICHLTATCAAGLSNSLNRTRKQLDREWHDLQCNPCGSSDVHLSLSCHPVWGIFSVIIT